MRSPMLIAAIVASLLGADRRSADPAARPAGPRPPARLDPDRAASGNKARLTERYLRRQARIAKRTADHG